MTTSEANIAWVATAGPNAAKVVAQIEGKTLRELELRGAGLPSLPPAIVVEGGWTQLDLSENPGIDPSLLSDLDRVEILQLKDSELSSFDISLPPGLKRLTLKGNSLTTWPSGLAAASDLEYLDLQRNQLTELPEAVGALESLDTLHMGANDLTMISPAIGQLTGLKRLVLVNNRRLDTLPAEILELPSACRVSLTATALPRSVQKAKTVDALREVWSDLEGA